MPYLANPARYQEMPCRRCGRGITHFDLANNYGPPPGSAETNFGRVLREDFASHLTPARLAQVRRLHDVAQARGQSLAQLALAWLLKDERVTSVLVGASRPEQLNDSLGCLANLTFAPDELAAIEQILAPEAGA